MAVGIVLSVATSMAPEKESRPPSQGPEEGRGDRRNIARNRTLSRGLGTHSQAGEGRGGSRLVGDGALLPPWQLGRGGETLPGGEGQALRSFWPSVHLLPWKSTRQSDHLHHQ